MTAKSMFFEGRWRQRTFAVQINRGQCQSSMLRKEPAATSGSSGSALLAVPFDGSGSPYAASQGCWWKNRH